MKVSGTPHSLATHSQEIGDQLDKDIINPKARYEVAGRFDEGAYETDLQLFPDYFDINGWPLFGDYDQYSLTHPITGENWHLSPRVPRKSELDKDYEFWFFVATQFNEMTSFGWLLLESGRFRKAPFSESEPHIVYKATYPFGVKSNFNEIRRLTSLVEPELATRSLSVKFLYDWGELTAAYARFEVSIDRGEAATKCGNAKAAQVKWLLHVRQAYESRATLRKINELLKSYIFQIATGNAQPPDGFTQEWFQAACGQSADRKKFVRDFPDALKKPGRKEYQQNLLRSPPVGELKIPPVPDFLIAK